MYSRIPQLKPTEFVRALERLGFVVRRQTGSHVIMRHQITKRMASIPVHPRDCKRGLLFGILKQAGITTDDFLKVL
ncbi:MAG: type II toxin-antitoxin system HicA family toxin [bacterium]|nr:type II toxin-antitoxin system HicA family toxin [bacterium]